MASFNHSAWKNAFASALAKRDFQKIRSLRADIFQNTLDIVNEGSYDDVNQNKVVLPNPEGLINDSRFYDSQNKIVATAVHGETVISVEETDCLVAGRVLLEQGFSPAVLNMASRQNPGGGVLKGAGAQEENIFRRSNIFLSLYQFAEYASLYGLARNRRQYPKNQKTGSCYSPDVTIFRGTEQDGYPLLETPYQLSIISVPAINRPQLKTRFEIADYLIEPTKEKMRTIFRLAHRYGHDAIVLGAMGCGAYCNPPQHVAKLFHQVLEESEFKNRFRHICFAILDDHNAHKSHNPQGNLLPFLNEFQ